MNIKNILILLITLTCSSASATNIIITYEDDAGVGFNDTTPHKATSDNPATTIGEARKYILETTTELFSTQIHSTSDIFWSVSFSELGDFGAVTIGPTSTELLTVQELDPFGILELGRVYPYLLTNALNDNTNTLDYADDYDALTLFSSLYDNLTFSLIDGKNRLSSVILHELVHVVGFSGADCLGDCIPQPLSRKNQFSQYVFVADNINGQWDDLSIIEKERVGRLENQVTFKGTEPLNIYAQNNLTSGFNGQGVELHTSPNDDGSYDNQSISHLSENVQPEQLMHSAGKDVMELGIAAYMLCDIGWCRNTGFVTDLAITQNETLPIAPNAQSPITVEFVNLGEQVVTDAVVELTFPIGAVVSESMLDSNCALTETLVRCTYTELNPNSYMDLTVYVTMTQLSAERIKSKIYSTSYIVDINGTNNLSITPLIVQMRDFPTIVLDDAYEFNTEASVSITPSFSAQDDDNLRFDWLTDSDINFTQDNTTGQLTFTAPNTVSTKTFAFVLQALSNGRTIEKQVTIKIKPLKTTVIAGEESSGGGSSSFGFLISLLLISGLRKYK